MPVVREAVDAIDAGPLRAAAAQILVACFPLLLADMVRRAHPMTFDQFQLLPSDGGALAPGLAEDDADIVTTSAWIDVSRGAVLLRLPPTLGRYFNLTLFDTAGEPFASLGSRSGDDAGVDLALIGPSWQGSPPAGFVAKRAPSEGVWAVSRTHARSAADRPDTVALARLQRIASLGGDVDGRQAGVRGFELPSSPCLRRAVETKAPVFFQRLDSLLARAPEYFRDGVLAQVTTLRNELGGPPPAHRWSADFARALSQGLSDGFTAIKTAADADGGASGWRAARPLENGNILARAARAYAGMGARVRAELLTLVCERDDSGRRLSGADSYHIRFPVGRLPPARSGWRLSARPPAAADTRHGLSDRDELVLDRSGVLDVVVGRTPGDAGGGANWLPAPDGGFSLVMNLCWPKPEALNGVWSMPPVERLESAWGASSSTRSPRAGRPHTQ